MVLTQSPHSIYHAFDLPFSKLTLEKLHEIQDLGFTHIQVSPVQECFDYGEWHAKYQPISYQIGNSYGNEAELRNLIQRIHSLSLKIIVDVVFNHLAVLRVNQKIITTQDWKTATQDPSLLKHYQSALIQSYSHLFEPKDSTENTPLFQDWSEAGWIGGALPQLNPQHPKVKDAHLNFLKHLIQLGVDGFRFDGIEHIGTESMAEYLQFLQSPSAPAWTYGEIVTTNPSQARPFSDLLPITNYEILDQLISAFSFHGNLISLKPYLEGMNRKSIVFSTSHDTYAAQLSQGKHGVLMNFATEEDADLAALLLLSHPTSVPLFLSQDAHKEQLRPGFQFRKELLKRGAQKWQFIPFETFAESINPQVLLIATIEDAGLVFLNKSAEDIHLPYLPSQLHAELAEVYFNTATGERLRPSNSWVVPKRSCEFFLGK